MNYKIKVTSENREAIKDIANRKGMNPLNLKLEANNIYYYVIENNVFIFSDAFSNYQELTFEQFKAMFDKENQSYINPTQKEIPSIGSNKEFDLKQKITFDKQETDLDKWLRETKDKNLNFNQLWEVLETSSHENIWKKLEGNTSKEKTEILYNQWNEPKPQGKIIGYEMIKDFPNKRNRKVGHIFLLEDNEEFENFSNYPEFLKPVFENTSTEPKEEWQPKRSDRVLVWDNCEKDAVERIFLAEIKGIKYPIITVHLGQENFFIENQEFSTNNFKHMKPLPIAPTKPEKTFKEKVIELVEKNKKDLIEARVAAECSENEEMEKKLKFCILNIISLLEKIKELN